MTRAELLAKLLVQSCDTSLPLKWRLRADWAIGEVIAPRIVKPGQFLGPMT
jgi:hypothetical protein